MAFEFDAIDAAHTPGPLVSLMAEASILLTACRVRAACGMSAPPVDTFDALLDRISAALGGDILLAAWECKQKGGA